MERSLLWSTLILGCVGWAGAALLTAAQQPSASRQPHAESDVARPFLLLAVLLPVLIFLATLPTRPPFGVGQGWGRGFVLGSLGSLLSTWILTRAHAALADAGQRSLRSAAAVSAPFFLGLVAVALPLLFMRATIIDALAGVALGWFCVSFVLSLGLPSTSLSYHLGLLAGIGFTVTLCAVAALGIYREPITPGVAKGAWSTLGMLFACGVPLSLLLSALLTRILVRPASNNPINRLFAAVGSRFFPGGRDDALAGCGYNIVLCIVLLLALGNLLSLKVVEEPRVLYVILLGVFAGLVTWWLAGDTQADELATRAPAIGEPVTQEARVAGVLSPLAVLVMLSAFMVSYQLLQGFGVGLMLLAAWMSFAQSLPAALQDETESTEHPAQLAAVPLALSRVLLFATVLLLYRLFSMRFRNDLHGVALTDHYAFFGFLTGAMTPGLLSGLLCSPALAVEEERGLAGRRLGRMVLVAVLALAVPASILVLWGAKCALALLAGLALSTVVGHWPAGSTPRMAVLLPRATVTTSLLAVAIALALTQWTHRVLPIAEMTRADRIRVLGGIVGGFLILLLVADYGGRLVDWAQRRRAVAAG